MDLEQQSVRFYPKYQRDIIWLEKCCGSRYLDIANVDCVIFDSLSYKVTAGFYVFSSLMENCICCNMRRSLLVTKQTHRALMINAYSRGNALYKKVLDMSLSLHDTLLQLKIEKLCAIFWLFKRQLSYPA